MLLSLLALLLAPLAHALTKIARPELDFPSIGNKVLFAGSFDLILFFDYPSQQYLLTTNVSSFDQLQTTLYSQDAEGNVIPLGDLNGAVRVMTPVSSQLFALSGLFNSINLYLNLLRVNIGLLVLYNGSSGNFVNMDPANHVSGTVSTIYATDEIVFIGGSLLYQDTYGVVIYNLTLNSLAPAPFFGFEKGAKVTLILAVGDSIVFGGSFYRLGLPELQFTNQLYYLAHKDQLALNSTSSDNLTTEVQIQTEQLVLFKYASFQADNTKDGSAQPLAITCPLDNLWIVNNNQLGAWLATLPFLITPSKIRVYNARGNDVGVKMFRLYTSPSNSIMNLTYIDPLTGSLAQCDAWCPLLSQLELSNAYNNINSSTLTNVSFNNDGGVAANLQWTDDYQDFGFVNNLEVNYLNFHIVDYYGSNAGLSALQMFSTQILTFANNTLNEPVCGGNANSSYSEVSGDGWELSITGQYMANKNANPSDSVTFYPNILYLGNYSIDYITPGCQQDGTCDQRGLVEVSLYSDNGTLLASFTSAQSNQFEKIENVWNGHLNASTDSRPRVEIKATGGGLVVADKIAVTILGLDDLLNLTNLTLGRIHLNLSVSFNTLDYRIPLNGLFEYSTKNFLSFPSDYTTHNFSTSDFSNKFVGNSSVNQYGAQILGSIEALEYVNETLYIGGSFLTSHDGTNLVGLSLDGTDSNNNLKVTGKASISDGVNGEVSALDVTNGELIVAGSFNGTATQSSLTSVNGGSSADAALTKVGVLLNGKWLTIESGVLNVADVKHVFSVHFNDTDFLVFLDALFSLQSIWDNVNKRWFDNSAFNSTGLYLNITGASASPSGMNLVTGHLAILGKMANNVVSLDNHGLFSALTVKFAGDNNVVNQALYFNDSFSALGGNFTTTNANESNLVVIQGLTVIGFPQISWGNSSVETLAKDESGRFLFVGLNGTAMYNNEAELNVLIYDLFYGNMSVPGAVSKNGLTSKAAINTFFYDPDTSKVYVGGDFDTASALPCLAFCVFNLGAQRWESDVSDGMSAGSVISYMNVTSSLDSLLVGGQFTLSGLQYYFLNYNFKDQSFNPISDFQKRDLRKRDTSVFPGAVKKYILVDGSANSNNRLLVLGDNFLAGYNKSVWVRIDEIGGTLDTTKSKFMKFQLLNDVVNKNAKSKSAASTEFFDTNSQLLLVTGQLVFKNYGNLAMGAAIFNGLGWYPYLYTTSASNNGGINDFFVNKAIAVDQAEAASVKHLMDRGWIVFIGLALAVGTMMLLTALAMVVLFWKRKHDGLGEESQRFVEDDMVQTVPPEQLLNNMDEFKFTEK